MLPALNRAEIKLLLILLVAALPVCKILYLRFIGNLEFPELVINWGNSFVKLSSLAAIPLVFFYSTPSQELTLASISLILASLVFMAVKTSTEREESIRIFTSLDLSMLLLIIAGVLFIASSLTNPVEISSQINQYTGLDLIVIFEVAEFYLRTVMSICFGGGLIYLFKGMFR